LIPGADHPLVQSILRAFPGAQVRTPREGIMIDPSEHEVAALEAASPLAGEYLESIGKTDLATMSEDEWMTLLDVVVTGFQDNLIRLKSSEAPF
jgi:hypothetical protein